MLAHSTVHDPSMSAEDPTESRALSRADRDLLTPEVLARWRGELGDDELPLAEIVRFERGRRRALQTLRQNAELTDLEFKAVRYLQKRTGKVTSYLLLARHLWETPTFQVTAAQLRGVGGFASPMVSHIHVLASNIRRKLEIDPIRPQHLGTVRGVGYIWYDDPPSLDDGVNYEARATQIVGLQRTMHALIGDVSEEMPVDHQLAAQVGLELEARQTIQGEYEPVEEERPRFPRQGKTLAEADAEAGKD